MAIIPSSIDFSDKDFDSWLLRLQNVLQSTFPEWTDFNRASFGNILLELYAFTLDTTSFYQDAQARETRIVTARRRKNLLALGKLIGFEPKGNTPAQSDQVFTLAAVPTNDVVFPTGTIVRTAEITGSVEFRLLAPLTIAASTNPPTAMATVENSVESQDVFTSTGLPNQEFALTRIPFISTLPSPGGVTDDANNFSQVDNFLNSSSSDYHYTITVDENDRATITFGNGVNGAVPIGTITVTYKTGGGVVGNVDAGRINRIVGSFTDILSNPVSVTTTNPEDASGGADRESNDSIRQRAPETLRVLNRAVAREDYEIAARQVAGVSRALMLTSNEDETVDENAGNLYVIATGGGAPSQALKDSVLAQFVGASAAFPRTLTFNVQVLDPIFLDTTVQATIYFTSNDAAAKTTAANAVRTNLTAFFASENSDGSLNEDIGFGFDFKDASGNAAGEIPLSTIHNVVRDTPGIRKIGDLVSDFQINGQHRDLSIASREFPRLTTITLIDGDTGNTV